VLAILPSHACRLPDSGLRFSFVDSRASAALTSQSILLSGPPLVLWRSQAGRVPSEVLLERDGPGIPTIYNALPPSPRSINQLSISPHPRPKSSACSALVLLLSVPLSIWSSSFSPHFEPKLTDDIMVTRCPSPKVNSSGVVGVLYSRGVSRRNLVPCTISHRSIRGNAK
jgi:hypothetical protein